MRNQQARIKALATYESFQLKPTSLLRYQSQGRVVVIGGAGSLLAFDKYPDAVSITRVLTGDLSGTNHFEYRVEKPQHIRISGYLGNFQIRIGDTADNSHILNADIVLDGQPEALLKREILPAGYLHLPLTSENADQVKAELLDMIGVFEKPKYFNYDPSICAHSSNGVKVCTQCIDACPAEAITSLANMIEVNPYLCQGGGSCAAVCPSGAMQYVYPGLQDNGNRLRKMLQSYREQGGVHPLVMFHSEQEFPQHLLQEYDFLLPFHIEELASVGADMWLTAIAFGAEQVVLLANDEVPALSLRKLREQLEWCQAILAGLNLDSVRLSLIKLGDEIHQAASGICIQPAEYHMPDDKRKALYQAIDHLYQQAEKTRELVVLPSTAPFGSATIDETRCTLCMACVGACPGRALQDGSNREIPEIFFIESHCIQCGTCTHTCPEDAISISPRLILDREKRNQSRVLNQDTPFACISCGKAFAPTSVIQKMTFALKDHYMFSNERARNRLKMCDDCRVADIVQDPDALKGSFDPLAVNSGKPLS